MIKIDKPMYKDLAAFIRHFKAESFPQPIVNILFTNCSDFV